MGDIEDLGVEDGLGAGAPGVVSARDVLVRDARAECEAMARVWVRSYGCCHNTSDGEYMAGQLQSYGYRRAHRPMHSRFLQMLWQPCPGCPALLSRGAQTGRASACCLLRSCCQRCAARQMSGARGAQAGPRRGPRARRPVGGEHVHGQEPQPGRGGQPARARPRAGQGAARDRLRAAGLARRTRAAGPEPARRALTLKVP